jgi:hypothetical protein
LGDGFDEEDVAVVTRLMSRIECNEKVCIKLFERCIETKSIINFLDILSGKVDATRPATRAIQRLLCLESSWTTSVIG